MHEVTEATTSAFPHFILATAGFSEVCDRGELSMDWLSIKPPVIQVYHGLLSVLFITELHIHISH